MRHGDAAEPPQTCPTPGSRWLELSTRLLQGPEHLIPKRALLVMLREVGKFSPDPFQLLGQGRRIHGQVVVDRRPHCPRDQEATANAAASDLVILAALDIPENRLSRKAISLAAVRSEVTVEKNTCALTSKEHEVARRLAIERQPRPQAIRHQEPSPGPVAAQGHRTEASSRIMERNCRGLP